MYEATLESVKTHPLPAWYQDAKFGIFIHWTISSVPAFAPTGLGDITKLFAEKSQAYVFAHQPYAEWYQNSLRIKGSPAYEYHLKTYGEAYRYEAFGQVFNEKMQSWDPAAWADLFARAGARYVVLVTKHHDGFLFWNSRYPNPRMPDYRTRRDVTGELTHSVTARGMKMGLYYSSALDWTFTTQPIQDFADLLTSGPTSLEYVRYVENQWKELIDRYEPWVLWSDIGYPPGYDLPKLFAYYYNQKPEGVVNDRWMQLPKLMYNPVGRFVLKQMVKRMMQSSGASMPAVPHCDYRTAEYANMETKAAYAWESVRGIGNSFAYNQFETPNDYLHASDLIRMLADIVSKNGNLLLNIGPRPDGSIPQSQVDALEGIGRWLGINGEAIYGTRPWTRAGDDSADGQSVRYTAKGSALYIILTHPPAAGGLRLANLPLNPGCSLTLLGTEESVRWTSESGECAIHLPADLDWEAVPVLRLAEQ